MSERQRTSIVIEARGSISGKIGPTTRSKQASHLIAASGDGLSLTTPLLFTSTTSAGVRRRPPDSSHIPSHTMQACVRSMPQRVPAMRSTHGCYRANTALAPEFALVRRRSRRRARENTAFPDRLRSSPSLFFSPFLSIPFQSSGRTASSTSPRQKPLSRCDQFDLQKARSSLDRVCFSPLSLCLSRPDTTSSQ